MKKIISTLMLVLFVSVSAVAQQDTEGCKDSPMFPKRMPNFNIWECKSNYNEEDFNLFADGNKIERKEGSMTRIFYTFDYESEQPNPSALQILKNYENAVKNIGGITVFQSSKEAIGTYKIMNNGKETAWVKIECSGSNEAGSYTLTIIELEEMNQEVTSSDILNALNSAGHITLYINFETGKSDIKTESQKTIDQIIEMLKANPTLKILIEGHTDNVGNPTSNQTLSENRAKSVMNALIANGIDKSRLASKGLGQTKPIADNNTEDGKGKNCRVEIVKL